MVELELLTLEEQDGGGADANGLWGSNPFYAYNGSMTGGAGGDGRSWRQKTSYAQRYAGGGAGNPGGQGKLTSNETGNKDYYGRWYSRI